MAETPAKRDALLEGVKHQTPKPPRKQNPVFRMMGLPNIKFKLPSRNWSIFLSVTGSFAAAIVYDRRQKKVVQKKWCDLVAHIAQEPLAVRSMPRKLNIFLSAPPGDGIRPSREYFKEYIKPILVAAAMDYDVFEGRKEGDIRYGTAQNIRRLRIKEGEVSETEAEEPDQEQLIEMVRVKMQTENDPGTQGDLVLGRHTWKEYVRGVHEGWLGPIDEPSQLVSESSAVDESSTPQDAANIESTDGAKSEEPETKPEEPKKILSKPSAYISTSAYSSSPVSQHTPQFLEPSQPIHQQHLLGFFKTPQRIYNFLNRRHLADQIGRDTAAVVLAAHRPYQQSSSFASTSASDLDSTPLATKAPESDIDNGAIVQTGQSWEQQNVLDLEELTWHKSARTRKPEDVSERVWMDDVVMDARIAERMRKFELEPEEEDRASRIGSGAEKGRAYELENLER